MIAVLLLLIAVLVASSAVMYFIMSGIDRTQALARTQQDVQTLDIAMAMVTNHMAPVGASGSLAAVIADVSGDRGRIPASWGIDSINSYGNELIYCPLGDQFSPTNSGLPSASIPINDSASYDARYVSDSSGQKFVVESNASVDGSLAANKAIALVISPTTNPAVTCEDVVISSSGPIRFGLKAGVTGAMVRGVLRDSIISYQANQPVTVSATDSGVAFFDDLTSAWSVTKPFSVRYEIESSLGLSKNLQFKDLIASPNKSIAIVGVGTGASVISTAISTVTFENVSVIIDGMSFGQDIHLVFKNSKLRLSNSTFSGEVLFENSQGTVINSSFNNGASLLGSDLKLEGGVSLSNSSSLAADSISSAVELRDSSIMQSGSFTATAGSNSGNAIYASNSTWSVPVGGTIAINTSTPGASAIKAVLGSTIQLNNTALNTNSNGAQTTTLFDIYSGSSLRVSGSSINVAGPASAIIRDSGIVEFFDSTLVNQDSVGKLFVLENGSGLVLDGATVVGSSAATVGIGVYDSGASKVSGSGATIKGQQCNWGPIFSYPDSVTMEADTKAALQRNFKIFNSTNWSCN